MDGTAGEELMQLQSSYGGDTRFNLDARFAEAAAPLSEAEAAAAERRAEKASELRVLEKVLGRALPPSQAEEDAKRRHQRRGMLRFDPDNPAHDKFQPPLVPSSAALISGHFARYVKKTEMGDSEDEELEEKGKEEEEKEKKPIQVFAPAVF